MTMPANEQYSFDRMGEAERRAHTSPMGTTCPSYIVAADVHGCSVTVRQILSSTRLTPLCINGHTYDKLNCLLDFALRRASRGVGYAIQTCETGRGVPVVRDLGVQQGKGWRACGGNRHPTYSISKPWSENALYRGHSHRPDWAQSTYLVAPRGLYRS